MSRLHTVYKMTIINIIMWHVWVMLHFSAKFRDFSTFRTSCPLIHKCILRLGASGELWHPASQRIWVQLFHSGRKGLFPYTVYNQSTLPSEEMQWRQWAVDMTDWEMKTLKAILFLHQRNLCASNLRKACNIFSSKYKNKYIPIVVFPFYTSNSEIYKHFLFLKHV